MGDCGLGQGDIRAVGEKSERKVLRQGGVCGQGRSQGPGQRSWEDGVPVSCTEEDS